MRLQTTATIDWRNYGRCNYRFTLTGVAIERGVLIFVLSFDWYFGYDIHRSVLEYRRAGSRSMLTVDRAA
jgi:hypothetical protein